MNSFDISKSNNNVNSSCDLLQIVGKSDAHEDMNLK